MSPTWKSRLLRWRINWYPCYRGTGARVVHISDDRRAWRVALPLNRRTRNIWGTIFGGSMYAAVDPMYGLMLADQLGPGALVFTKEARIRFRRTGRSALTADFALGEEVLAPLRETLAAVGEAEHTFLVELRDASGEVATAIDVTYHVSRNPAVGRGIFPN